MSVIHQSDFLFFSCLKLFGHHCQTISIEYQAFKYSLIVTQTLLDLLKLQEEKLFFPIILKHISCVFLSRRLLVDTQ